MPDITIANLKDDLKGIVHSTTIDKVTNFNRLAMRAARNVLAKIDPASTIRIANITSAVHDDIYDYSAPSDLKGKKLIDIRPQVNREEQEVVSARFLEAFDRWKTEKTFQVRQNKGVKTLRLSATISPEADVLHNMNSLTANGTWAAGDDATNLTRDTLNYISGNACANFDLDGSGTTGYIENSDMDSVDLSDLEDIAQMFVRVYFPDASAITNVILRWGSDSSNYWSATATAPHDQSDFKNGWNIIAFEWNGATETGSPDSSAVDYVRVTITYDGTADTDFRVDKISASSGEIWELVYYSNCLFSTSGGTWQVNTDDDADIINLDEDGYNIFVNECGLLISQQIQGEDARQDKAFFRRELYGDPTSPSRLGRIGLYAKYNEDHPTEAKKPRSYYWRKSLYDQPCQKNIS